MPATATSTVLLDGDAATRSVPGSPSSRRAARTSPTSDPVALFDLRDDLMSPAPAPAAPGRRHRLRRGRPDRRLRRLADRPRHPLRGRRPPRRARRHAPVTAPDGEPLAIDTGFIVHNERTYPTLLRLFAELGVATQESDMSMSVRDDATGLEWAGALGAAGLFPTWRNAARPAYLRMLTEIPRFHRRARALLAARPRPTAAADDDQTLREFLRAGGFSAYFTRHFMEPVVAAVWSSDPRPRAGLPRALPLLVPRPPRDARHLRLAAVAHGHRRLARVRRPGSPPGSTTSAPAPR